MAEQFITSDKITQRKSVNEILNPENLIDTEALQNTESSAKELLEVTSDILGKYTVGTGPHLMHAWQITKEIIPDKFAQLPEKHTSQDANSLVNDAKDYVDSVKNDISLAPQTIVVGNVVFDVLTNLLSDELVTETGDYNQLISSIGNAIKNRTETFTQTAGNFDGVARDYTTLSAQTILAVNGILEAIEPQNEELKKVDTLRETLEEKLKNYLDPEDIFAIDKLLEATLDDLCKFGEQDIRLLQTLQHNPIVLDKFSQRNTELLPKVGGTNPAEMHYSNDLKVNENILETTKEPWQLIVAKALLNNAEELGIHINQQDDSIKENQAAFIKYLNLLSEAANNKSLLELPKPLQDALWNARSLRKQELHIDNDGLDLVSELIPLAQKEILEVIAKENTSKPTNQAESAQKEYKTLQDYIAQTLSSEDTPQKKYMAEEMSSLKLGLGLEARQYLPTLQALAFAHTMSQDSHMPITSREDAQKLVQNIQKLIDNVIAQNDFEEMRDLATVMFIRPNQEGNKVVPSSWTEGSNMEARVKNTLLQGVFQMQKDLEGSVGVLDLPSVQDRLQTFLPYPTSLKVMHSADGQHYNVVAKRKEDNNEQQYSFFVSADELKGGNKPNVLPDTSSEEKLVQPQRETEHFYAELGNAESNLRKRLNLVSDLLLRENPPQELSIIQAVIISGLDPKNQDRLNATESVLLAWKDILLTPRTITLLERVSAADRSIHKRLNNLIQNNIENSTIQEWNQKIPAIMDEIKANSPKGLEGDLKTYVEYANGGLRDLRVAKYILSETNDQYLVAEQIPLALAVLNLFSLPETETAESIIKFAQGELESFEKRVAYSLDNIETVKLIQSMPLNEDGIRNALDNQANGPVSIPDKSVEPNQVDTKWNREMSEEEWQDFRESERATGDKIIAQNEAKRKQLAEQIEEQINVKINLDNPNTTIEFLEDLLAGSENKSAAFVNSSRR